MARASKLGAALSLALAFTGCAAEENAEGEMAAAAGTDGASSTGGESTADPSNGGSGTGQAGGSSGAGNGSTSGGANGGSAGGASNSGGTSSGSAGGAGNVSAGGEGGSGSGNLGAGGAASSGAGGAGGGAGGAGAGGGAGGAQGGAGGTQAGAGGMQGGAGGSGAGGALGGAGGSGAGGAADPGAGGTAGAGGAPGMPSGECTREILDALLDDYFAALSAGDAASLPLSNDVKFTENAEVTEIGTTDFWLNAGDVKYSQRALDTEACSVAAQAVVPESGMDLPIGIRIKLENGVITEVETIVVRPGDYTASFAVASDPDAIIAIADDIGWHDEVPEAERATREELADWVDTYFRAFPSGVCDVTGDCRRLENGGGNFSCGTGASCSGGSGGFDPRVIIVDEVRGIAAGFTIFDFMTTGHLDMHMMKMSGGQVHAVHAILRDTNGQSGWE